MLYILYSDTYFGLKDNNHRIVMNSGRTYPGHNNTSAPIITSISPHFSIKFETFCLKPHNNSVAIHLFVSFSPCLFNTSIF